MHTSESKTNFDWANELTRQWYVYYLHSRIKRMPHGQWGWQRVITSFGWLGHHHWSRSGRPSYKLVVYICYINCIIHALCLV